MHIYPQQKKHNVLYSHMLCITSSFTSFKASLVNTVVGTVVYSHVVTAATGAVLFHGTFATACWLLLRYIATSLVSAYYNIVGCAIRYICILYILSSSLYRFVYIQHSCNFVATKARITYNQKLFISYALAVKQFGRALYIRASKKSLYFCLEFEEEHRIFLWCVVHQCSNIT